MTKHLGRFGHHSNPAIDFCCEVDAIEGLAQEVRIGLSDRNTLFERVSRALDFNVGGDEHAIFAKHSLRLIAEQECD